MASVASASKDETDELGIERARKDEPGVIDRLRNRFEWLDHLMRMQQRYATHGGNQYSAGITYFSVLAVFPIVMLVFAGLGFVAAANEDTMEEIKDTITSSLDGELSEVVNQILQTAIDQRGTVAGIGAITALISGLGWMNHLRYGVSKMWALDPTDGSIVSRKLLDLVGLVGLILMAVLGFLVTAAGSSGLTLHLLALVGLDHVPGINTIVFLLAIAIGLTFNYLVIFSLLIFLPRTKVPRRSAAKAALIGAAAFEVIKQLGSLFASNALSNPAGATFGPIIGLMVVFYLIWRVLLYVSAWAATTKESLEQVQTPVPEPAVIRVRNDVAPENFSTKTSAGLGAALGAAVTALVAWLLSRK